MGNVGKAISDYTDTIRLDPSCAEAYYNRALAYQQNGKPDKAKADYAEFSRLAPVRAAARGIPIDGAEPMR